MAKRAILMGEIISRTVSPEFKDNARIGDKFHVKLADIEVGRYTGFDGTVYETVPVKFYDIKVSKEQFLSDKFQIGAKFEYEVHELEYNDKIYYRAYDLEN
jgi:hypothetical protein